MTAQGDPLPTVAELLLARADDANPGLVFEGARWTWAEHVRESADRAALLRSLRRPGPFHIGVLMDNVPEFSFLLGGAALAGAVLVGLNTGRRGEALVRDIRLADCQVVLTDSRYVELLHGLDTGARVLDVDSAAWHVIAFRHRFSPPEVAPARQDDLLMLMFTSGTTGEPKAVRCTHGTVAGTATAIAARHEVGPADTAYVSMPMFHSGAIVAGWAVGLAAGARIALGRRFSAAGFLPEVRACGATYAHYLGKSLSYVLSTPEQPDDADNPLRVVYGSEATPGDAAAFAARFGCEVVDAYGATESGVAVPRPPETPPGALGRLAPPLAVLDPAGRPCAPGEVGELVNTSGAGRFTGYYRDSAADAARLRDGRFWSGDLVRTDEDGFLYFAGRTADRLHVAGEDLCAAPIEQVILRHPPIADAAVYPVPGEGPGDQVMAAVVVRGEFDPDEFAAFLATQPDLEARHAPRFVRVTTRLPRTATYKVLKRTLSAQRWRTPDTVWWRPGDELEFEPLTPSSPPIRLDWGAGSVRP